MNEHIQKAIYELRTRAFKYARPERYYNGDHDLAFATEKFENTFGTLFREFALNLCPVICDAVRDKLRVTGFSVDDEGTVGGRRSAVSGRHFANSANSVNSATRQIWSRNRMGRRAGEVHKEVLKCGDAYMIVWPDEQGRATLYPNRAASMFVAYDEESPGRVAWAAKAWQRSDKYYRLNLYYPDRIEKYITKTATDGMLPDASGFVPAGPQAPLPARMQQHPDGAELLRPLTPEEPSRQAGVPAVRHVIPNPYGVVPVFHFANNADLGMAGRSELEAAIPVQDALNKSVLDMLVAMEYSAFRQRWAAGIDTPRDEKGEPLSPFKSGVDQIWITPSEDARFGDFEAAELIQFLKVKDSFRIDVASVTGTPLHYFLQTTGDLPSGESLKKAETRFLAKVRDRQESFGQIWADAMSLALTIEGHGRSIFLLTEWEDPSPMSDREFLENILLKTQIGLPVEQALIEAGYGEADVKRMTVS